MLYMAGQQISMGTAIRLDSEVYLWHNRWTEAICAKR